jgi:tetratricopeptide (TPR) repeat protein
LNVAKLITIVVLALLVSGAPLEALAFRVVRESNGTVVVYDNDYLDRRFGRTWTPRQRFGAHDQAGSFDSQARVAPRSIAVRPDHSLLGEISRDMGARRAAALRLAEAGRALLQRKQYQKALYHLEQALSLAASPLIYFYLARAHYHLGNYRSASSFVQVAEAGFHGDPEWSAALLSLKSQLSSSQTRPQAPIKHNVAWPNAR